MDRARRADAWWSALSDDQCLDVLAHIKAHGIEAVVPFVARTLSLKVSKSAVGRFYKWARLQERKWTIEKALVDKDQLEAAARKLGRLDESIVTALGLAFLDASVSRDSEQIRVFGERYMEMLSLAQTDRRIRLLEERIAEARAKLAEAQGTAVDPKVLADEIDRILGRKS